ncbi:hypothetical protein [Mannheimia granulomatis]|nr:hypothetical protein [Mannheimia granulomatis]
MLRIRGKMSQKAADQADEAISEGLRFLFKSIGIALAVVLIITLCRS